MIQEMTLEEYSAALRSGQFQSSICPFEKLLNTLGSKWSTRILYQLTLNPTMRFGEFKKQIPDITNTMLTNTLRSLEEKEIISRTQYNEIPPRVEYCLTPYGNDLISVVFEAAKWCEKYDSAHP